MQIKIVNKSPYDNPFYATEGAAGMDLKAHIESSITLAPLERTLVKTGLFMELPMGYEAITEEDKHALSTILQLEDCFPVWLPSDVENAFLNEFCMETLWPVFHSIVDTYNEKPTRWWDNEDQTHVSNLFCAFLVNFHHTTLKFSLCLCVSLP